MKLAGQDQRKANGLQRHNSDGLFMPKSESFLDNVMAKPQGGPPALPGWVRVQACSVQGGANPPQVNLLRPVAKRNCVAVRRGGEQRKANRVVRSESKLDSALTGEPAHQRRSLYLCKRGIP
jgi:hypothetical protein